MDSDRAGAVNGDPRGEEDLRRRYKRIKIASFAILLTSLAAQVMIRKWYYSAPTDERGLPALLFFASTIALLFSCSMYARVKGRSAWFGLLGFMHVIGFFFLVLILRRKCLRCGTRIEGFADACPRCSAPL